MKLLPVSMLLAALLFAGCGQKGPLFLPGDPSEVRTEIPEVDREALPSAADDDDGEDEESADENRSRRE